MEASTPKAQQLLRKINKNKYALLTIVVPTCAVYGVVATFCLITYKVGKLWPEATSSSSWKFLTIFRRTYVIDPSSNLMPVLLQEAELIVPKVSYMHLILLTACSFALIMLIIALCTVTTGNPDANLMKWTSVSIAMMWAVSMAVDISFAIHFLLDYRTLNMFMNKTKFSSEELYTLDMARLGAFFGAMFTVKFIGFYIYATKLIISTVRYTIQYEKEIEEETHAIHQRGIIQAFRESWRHDTSRDEDLTEVPPPPPPPAPRSRRGHPVEPPISTISSRINQASRQIWRMPRRMLRFSDSRAFQSPLRLAQTCEVINPPEFRRTSRRGLSVTVIPELHSPVPEIRSDRNVESGLYRCGSWNPELKTTHPFAVPDSILSTLPPVSESENKRTITTTALIEQEVPSRRRSSPCTSSKAESSTISSSQTYLSAQIDDSILPDTTDDDDRATLKTLTPPLGSPNGFDEDSIKTLTPALPIMSRVELPIHAPQRYGHPEPNQEGASYYFWPIALGYEVIEPKVPTTKPPPTIIISPADDERPPQRPHQPEPGRNMNQTWDSPATHSKSTDV